MTLQEYQDILFGILCVVDDICKKNHIMYMLHGGSMLGAVRNHDFIPWDDDVDIIVWQKDYELLCAKLREQLPQHLRIVTPNDLLPNFFDFVTRVQDIRYTVHEPAEEDLFYENKQNHAFIDIFQFVYSANTKWQIKWIALKHKILYGFGMGHRYRINSEKYTWIQKCQTKFLSSIGATIDMGKILKWRNRLIHKQGKSPKRYCMSVNSPLRGIERPYESEWYYDVCYMQFRNRQFPVPRGYDSHLTLQYGNYMVPDKGTGEYVKHFIE